jgi:hypothetical protein
MLSINVAVLLTVIVVARLRRNVEPRTRADQTLTVAIVVVLGVLIAPTAVGHSIFDFVERLASGITAASR